MEFFFQAEYEKSFINRINFIAKAFMSKRLDKLVFNSAEALIFASEAMRKFYIKQYPAVANKKYTILPYLLISPKPNPVDFALKQQLVEKFNIRNDEKIFLFAGAFKKIGGVPDLITAYNFISKKNKNTRLFIIGDGPSMEECKALITKLKIDNNVFLIGRIPYTFLRTYQDIAHIIVCPDKKNPFSELIVHVKYLDAWASGKIVIVGAFESVKEINRDESLSLMFEPSNLDSLSNVMQKALNEYEMLLNKYRNTSNYTLENLSYSNFISNKPLIAAEI
jgi:glycosyltransferase involved in cell wall biosynthesis